MSLLNHADSRSRIRKLLALVLLLAASQSLLAANNSINPSAWMNISDSLIAAMTNSGAKIPWPGNTAGVAVDRVTGVLYLDVCNLGLWQSLDHGNTFQRIAAEQISGRCEFGYAINCDPAGSRMACLMLDGKGGLTLDGARTWRSFAGMGRNWNYGAVDWSDPRAKSIFADRHESGGEKYLSNDAGAHWKFLGRHPEFDSLGIFDSHTLVAGTTNGILRSTDAGQSWKKISALHPVGRVAIYFNGRTYWLAREGLLTSTDKGLHWHSAGAPLDAGWGPLFGKNASDIVVADTGGFLKSADGGRTWKRLAPLPPFKGELVPKLPGQFTSIAWDPQANLLYASRMGAATYRLQLPASEK